MDRNILSQLQAAIDRHQPVKVIVDRYYLTVVRKLDCYGQETHRLALANIPAAIAYLNNLEVMG